MFTSIDKALVALVMAILFLINTFTGFNIGVSEETIAGILTALTPVLVYLIPNKRTHR